MASRQAWNICRNCRVFFKCATERIRVPCFTVKHKQKGFLTITSALAFCEAKQKLDLQTPDETSAKQEHGLKAASSIAADTVTTLISRTAYALVEAEQKYRDMVTALIQLLEYHIGVLGNEEEEKRVMTIITEARGWLQTYHKHIEDLEQLLSSVQKLADASAEVAFLAGSEFTSTSLGERVYHASRHIDGAREQRRQMDQQLREVEAHCSEAIAKHAEAEERRKEAEDALFGAEEEQGTEGQEKPAEGQEKPAERDPFGVDLSEEEEQEAEGQEKPAEMIDLFDEDWTPESSQKEKQSQEKLGKIF